VSGWCSADATDTRRALGVDTLECRVGETRICAGLDDGARLITCRVIEPDVSSDRSSRVDARG
jgi:hypothetical protein